MNFIYCNSFVLIVLCSVSVFCIPVDNIKDKIHPCLTKDSALQKCMMEVGNALFKELHKGDKDLGIPILDPLFVPKMELLAGKEAVHLNLMNSTQKGLGSSVIKSIMADPEHYKFEITMVLPKYVIEGTYDVNAMIAMLPIVGKGPSVITLNNMTNTWQIEGTPVVKDGKKYIKITSFKVNLSPTKMTFILKDLFNGNKELGEIMNTFLNTNWEEVFKQLKPLMESKFSELLLKLTSNVLEKVPYSNMFPDMV